MAVLIPLNVTARYNSCWHFEKLKSGKKYCVQVKAYKLDSTKQKVYGKWSKTVSKAVK